MLALPPNPTERAQQKALFCSLCGIDIASGIGIDIARFGLDLGQQKVLETQEKLHVLSPKSPSAIGLTSDNFGIDIGIGNGGERHQHRYRQAFIATLLFDPSMSALPITETQKSQSVGLCTRQ